MTKHNYDGNFIVIHDASGHTIDDARIVWCYPTGVSAWGKHEIGGEPIEFDSIIQTARELEEVKEQRRELLEALETIVHEIIIYEFLSDFEDGDNDFRKTFRDAVRAIAKVKVKL